MISSPADSSAEKPGTRFQKPRADIYTVLLVIALAAIIAAGVCLYLHNEAYDWDYSGGPMVSAGHLVMPATAKRQPWAVAAGGSAGGSPWASCPPIVSGC